MVNQSMDWKSGNRDIPSNSFLIVSKYLIVSWKYESIKENDQNLIKIQNYLVFCLMRVQGVQFCCAQLKAVVALACRIITFSIAAVQTIVRKVFPTIRSIFYFIRLIRSLKIDRMVFKVLRTWLERSNTNRITTAKLKNTYWVFWQSWFRTRGPCLRTGLICLSFVRSWFTLSIILRIPMFTRKERWNWIRHVGLSLCIVINRQLVSKWLQVGGIKICRIGLCSVVHFSAYAPRPLDFFTFVIGELCLTRIRAPCPDSTT